MRVILLAIIVSFLTPLAWGKNVIVPSEFENTQGLRLASEFLNEYATLLNSNPTEETNDKLRRVKEDGFSYIIGNDEIMRGLTGTEDFSISFENGKYQALWSVNGKCKVSCSFPANIGLLTFLNKIELETQLINRLKEKASTIEEITLPIRETANLKPITFSDYYLEDKGFYITPRLKHQLVFEQEKKGSQICRLLTDTVHYQMESLANMMLTGFSKFTHPVKVKVSKYGYGSQIVDMPYSSLYKFLADEGSIPYWGVDTFDGKMVKGLWVWINKEGGYAHMLSVTMPVSVGSTSTPINAKLHCYLRLDNLKSLFEEYPEL